MVAVRDVRIPDNFVDPLWRAAQGARACVQEIVRLVGDVRLPVLGLIPERPQYVQ
ncbi:hypothetical protein SNK04_014322 [Fusarium graminearum]